VFRAFNIPLANTMPRLRKSRKSSSRDSPNRLAAAISLRIAGASGGGVTPGKASNRNATIRSTNPSLWIRCNTLI
jgi:hypothetical protein